VPGDVMSSGIDMLADLRADGRRSVHWSAGRRPARFSLISSVRVVRLPSEARFNGLTILPSSTAPAQVATGR
jgi:hypothetical protein